MTLLLPGYTEVLELGRGATGTVMLARHDATGAFTAVKHLAPELAEDAAFLAQFREEARLLERLRHPNIAALFEYREQSGEAVLAMEFVDGVSLRRVIEHTGATSPESALAVLKGSLLGLQRAHTAGVVHRDYKPENVMLTRDGDSKLLDFGVAVPAGGTTWRAGTPDYMAPEQWEGAAVSPSTDVYAATVTFYELLVGRRPYAGDLDALRTCHATAPIPVEEAPEPLRGLISTGMAKTPESRPGSASVLLIALETTAVAAYGDDWEERGRRRLAALLGGLLALFPLAAGETVASASAAVVADAVGTGGRVVRSARGRRRWLSGLLATGALLLGGAGGAYAGVAGGWGNSSTLLTTPAPGASPPAAFVVATPTASDTAPTEVATTSPSPTSSPTSSPTAAATPSVHATGTPTQSASARPTPTVSVTVTPTPAPSPTPTPSQFAVTTVNNFSLTNNCGNVPGVTLQYRCTFDVNVSFTGGPGTVSVQVDVAGFDCNTATAEATQSGSGSAGAPAGSGSVDIVVNVTLSYRPGDNVASAQHSQATDSNVQPKPSSFAPQTVALPNCP